MYAVRVCCVRILFADLDKHLPACLLVCLTSLFASVLVWLFIMLLFCSIFESFAPKILAEPTLWTAHSILWRRRQCRHCHQLIGIYTCVLLNISNSCHQRGMLPLLTGFTEHVELNVMENFFNYNSPTGTFYLAYMYSVYA